MMWRMLPDELKGCCATFLDTPSAGRFAAACREGQRLVLTQLVLMKLVDAVAALEPWSDSPTVDSDSARQLSDSPTVATVQQSDSSDSCPTVPDSVSSD